MGPIEKEAARIRALPVPVRLAGYLLRMAAVDECGARLWMAHTWTQAETDEYDRLCDDLDPWNFALTREELELMRPVTDFMAPLCCGETPGGLCPEEKK